MAGLADLWSHIMTKYPNWVEGAWGILIVHEVVYFGAFLPFWIADYIPALQKFKIQPAKSNDGTQLWRCFKWLLFLHFCVEFPLMFLTHPMLHWLGIVSGLPLPAWRTVIFQCIICFIIEDFYFYWIHRLLHWDKIYAYVHKVHHLHAAPFGITAEYAHPVETVFLGLGTALGPIIFSYLGTMHLFTLYAWLIVRLLQTVEVHSGYNFPWSLNNWVPYWGGAQFHDYHHMTFKSNYSSTFTVWDHVFKTDVKYLEYMANSAKKAQ